MGMVECGQYLTFLWSHPYTTCIAYLDGWIYMSDFHEGIRANGSIEKLTELYYLLISTSNITNIHLLVLFVN
jgi:hypothetical protein